MLDIEKLIAFWRHGAQEDLTVAQELLERGRIRHGLFFLHLALEKLLKAHVCRQTRDLAPRVHNLVRLAELAALHLPESCKDNLAAMNPFAMPGATLTPHFRCLLMMRPEDMPSVFRRFLRA